MTQERIDQMLLIISEDPHQSFSQIQKKILERKLQFSGPKGPNSENIVAFVLSYIPGVERVKPYHDFLGDLDADLVCELHDAEPVFIQVKTSRNDCEKFKGKIERRKKRGFKARIVSLCFECAFDDTIIDFTEQVNKLEGRDLLKPVKF